ncbi:MAG: McrC family protein [Nannocystaceae bacterium]|nr:McrC family protein [bacterium]
MKQKTIRVFEHGVLRCGRELNDRQFHALLAFNDAEGGDYFRAGHRKIRFRHYVGFLQVGGLAIEVLPKADKDAGGEAPWRDALIDMLRIVGSLRLNRSTEAQLRTRDASLLELYVLHFVGLTDRILREGLAKGYRRVQRNRPVFRGRLLLDQQLRKNAARPHFSFTEQAVFDQNTLPNSTLRAALEVVRHIPLSSTTRAEVDRVLLAFPDHVQPCVDLPALARLRLGRNTVRYAEALTLAALILRHHRPDLAHGRTEVFSLMLDMNALWERYVLALLRRIAPEHVTVRGQDSRPFWKAVGSSARSIRPDAVLYDGQTPRLVVDTKWKRPPNDRPASGDLQQMFAYNELFGCPDSTLLYPGDPTRGHRGGFIEKEHGCRVAFVDLVAGGAYSRSAAETQLRQLLDL